MIKAIVQITKHPLVHLCGFAVLLVFCFHTCKNKNPIDSGNPLIGDQPLYPQVDAYPLWSPDGESIIYNHGGIVRIDVGGNYYSDPDSAGLWMINADGTNHHLILKGGEECANWSPDGQWIVFESEAQIYKAPVVKDSIDTSHIAQLTFVGRNFFPAWSPDRQWITYNTSICEGPNSCGIWLMSPQGTQQRFLAAYGNYPTWDPLGLRILYLTRAVSSTGKVLGDSVWTFDIQSNTKSFFLFLGGNNYDNRYPKYAPDGKKIAFESDANIWVINSDRTNLKQNTVNGGLQPSWSPDGQKIVYIGFTNIKYDPQNNGTLWVMNSDGSNKRQLTYGPKLD